MLASFRLECEVIMNQYKSKMNEKAANYQPMTWKEFYEMFFQCFLPESLRDARAYEFDKLVQGDLTMRWSSRDCPNMLSIWYKLKKERSRGLFKVLIATCSKLLRITSLRYTQLQWILPELLRHESQRMNCHLIWPRSPKW